MFKNINKNPFEKSDIEKGELSVAKANYKEKQKEKGKIIKELSDLGVLTGGPLGAIEKKKEDFMNYKLSKERVYPPQYKFETEFSNEDNLEGFLQNFDLDPLQEAEMEAVRTISENPELGIIQQERMREEAVFAKAKELGIENEELPFEDRDIMGEQIADIKAKKLAKETRIKNWIERRKHIGKIPSKKIPFREQKIEERKVIEEKTIRDFELMQKAFRFKTFLDKFPLVEEKRPQDAGGKPLADNEIETLIKKYYGIKEKKNWKDYPKADLDLMQKCSQWGFFAKEYRKQKKMERPSFANGQEMTVEEMNELANKYRELEQKDPLAFAELKMEVGEWGKGRFEWKKEIFNGETQYSSILKGKDMIKKFVVREKDLPEDFKLEGKNTTNFYSIVSDFEIPEKKFSVFYIKLRKPYNIEEKKREPVYINK